MKSSVIIAAALLSAPLFGGSPVWAANELVTPVVLRTQFPVACAAGYHPDASGNCQPNNEQVDRFCPQAGTMYQPAPGGWACVPIPQGY
jgi:hypothetical protein